MTVLLASLALRAGPSCAPAAPLSARQARRSEAPPAWAAESQASSGPFEATIDNGVLTSTLIGRELQHFYPDLPRVGLRDVTLTRVRYRSRDFHGDPCSLSGLLAVPVGGAPKGLVLYYHGTTAMREEVPSRCTPTFGSLEAYLVIFAFASAGYAVAMPDYLGLGDGPGVHPFAFSRINSQSGIDMIGPARDYFSRKGVAVADALYVTGYSEGGAVAMWTTRRLQETPLPGLTVTASAPLSGAYDMSGVELPAILSGQSNPKWLAVRFYFAAYLAWAYAHLAMPEADAPTFLAASFVPSFATYVPYVFDNVTDDVKPILKLANKGLELGAVRTIKRALQPALVKALESRDRSKPFVRAVLEEDCTQWKPQTPMALICLTRDYLVPAANARNAVAEMRRRGAGPEVVRLIEVDRRGSDHLSFVPLALTLARRFFDRGFSALPSRP